MERRKIVILGAGHVGTHCAVSLMFQGLAQEIVLIDKDEKKAESQALDLNDMGACLSRKTIIRAGDYEDLKDAEIAAKYNVTRQAVYSWKRGLINKARSLNRHK